MIQSHVEPAIDYELIRRSEGMNCSEGYNSYGRE